MIRKHYHDPSGNQQKSPDALREKAKQLMQRGMYALDSFLMSILVADEKQKVSGVSVKQ